MTTIKHALYFETVLDETNPTSQQLLALPVEMQVLMLEGMLKQLLLPVLEPVLVTLNENNHFATLKAVA